MKSWKRREDETYEQYRDRRRELDHNQKRRWNAVLLVMVIASIVATLAYQVMHASR